MPQMAPIMWSPMFLLILCLVYLLTTNIYFFNSKNTNMKSDFLSKKSHQWMW